MDSRTMRDFVSWSVTLGRWRGVAIRLHAFFLLFGVLSLYLAASEAAQRDDADLIWVASGALAILLGSVFLHELGHLLAAWRVGGHAEEIVLGPLGGLHETPAPHDPEAERIVALAGPAANLLVLMLILPALWAIDASRIAGLLQPLRPRFSFFLAAPASTWISFLELTFWINWLLFLVNLLPAFPFDGGRVLRSFLWPVCGGVRTASFWVARAAQLTAVCLCAAAWFVGDRGPGLLPAWVPLVVLAIFLFFSGKQEIERVHEDEADPVSLGGDFLPDYLFEAPARPALHSRPNFVSRWLHRRREIRRQRTLEIEMEEERRADEILARVHSQGMQSLTLEERTLLERVSARYRQRQGHSTES